MGTVDAGGYSCASSYAINAERLTGSSGCLAHQHCVGDEALIMQAVDMQIDSDEWHSRLRFIWRICGYDSTARQGARSNTPLTQSSRRSDSGMAPCCSVPMARCSTSCRACWITKAAKCRVLRAVSRLSRSQCTLERPRRFILL